MDNRTLEEQNIIDFLEKAPSGLISDGFLAWLKEKGFFITSASANHHGNYAGALYAHSNEVRGILEDYTEKGLIEWDRPESPFIVGMFHDLCKIDVYHEEYDTYIEDDLGNKFGKGSCHFVFDDSDSIIPGHAEKSLIYLMPWLELTSQEIACIRWHMGAFDNKENWKYYSRACALDPAVLYTHTADMYASQCVGV